MHPPQDKRVFDKEAVTLADAGWRVTHLCPAELPSSEVRGVRIETYPKPRNTMARAWQIYDLYSRARALDADVYHCNELDSWIVGIAVRARYGKKCVFDVHEDYPSTFSESRIPAPLQSTVAGMIRLGIRALLPWTDRIVFAKRSVARDYPGPPGQSVLVQNFTPVAALSRATNRAQVPTPRQGRPLRLVHLGLISKVRGWPQLLDAIAQASDRTMELEVIGEFNDGTRAEFEARARELGLWPRIKISDWMPFDIAFERLLEAHVGLTLFQPGIQNHVYALPHKMFDYMLAECAQIAPNFAEEVAPIVRESDCGYLVDPSDPAAIAAALDALASDRGHIDEMGRNGRAAVLSRYNWENEAAKLVAMYSELAPINGKTGI